MYDLLLYSMSALSLHAKKRQNSSFLLTKTIIRNICPFEDAKLNNITMEKKPL